MLGNREDLVKLLSDSGLASAEITTLRGIARFPSIWTMVEADLRCWLPVMRVVPSEDQIGRILQQVEDVLGSYAAVDQLVSFHLSAHLVTPRKG